MTQETLRLQLRLQQAQERAAHWRRWGPYLAERQWGTVREDYSPYGCITLALVAPDFAKHQLALFLREWYMHPNLLDESEFLSPYEWRDACCPVPSRRGRGNGLMYVDGI